MRRFGRNCLDYIICIIVDFNGTTTSGCTNKLTTMWLMICVRILFLLKASILLIPRIFWSKRARTTHKTIHKICKCMRATNKSEVSSNRETNVWKNKRDINVKKTISSVRRWCHWHLTLHTHYTVINISLMLISFSFPKKLRNKFNVCNNIIFVF